MCEYCNVDNFSPSPYGYDQWQCEIINQGYCWLMVYYDKNNNVFSLGAEGDGYASKEMKFCFNCGRRLFVLC